MSGIDPTGSQALSDVAIAVAKKTQDIERVQGEAMIAQLKDAAHTGKALAARGAVSAHAGPGETGQRIDVTG